MSKYTHFTKLKHLIFLNGGSRCELRSKLIHPCRHQIPADTSKEKEKKFGLARMRWFPASFWGCLVGLASAKPAMVSGFLGRRKLSNRAVHSTQQRPIPQKTPGETNDLSRDRTRSDRETFSPLLREILARRCPRRRSSFAKFFFFLNMVRASKDPETALIMSDGLTAYNEDLQKI
jgi:hypothetical protein